MAFEKIASTMNKTGQKASGLAIFSKLYLITF
jgi:hypothetical protein